MLRECQINEIKFILADGANIKIVSEIGEDESYIALNAVETEEEWHMFDVKQYNDYLKLLNKEEITKIVESDIKQLSDEILSRFDYIPAWDIKVN